MSVIPSQFDELVRSIDASTQRHRVLSHNMANVNTPGYQRVDITFENLLDDAHHGTLQADPELVVDRTAIPRADGNTVDIDFELSELQKNAMAGGAYVQILASKLSMMKTAITGR